MRYFSNIFRPNSNNELLPKRGETTFADVVETIERFDAATSAITANQEGSSNPNQTLFERHEQLLGRTDTSPLPERFQGYRIYESPEPNKVTTVLSTHNSRIKVISETSDGGLVRTVLVEQIGRDMNVTESRAMTAVYRRGVAEVAVAAFNNRVNDRYHLFLTAAAPQTITLYKGLLIPSTDLNRTQQFAIINFNTATQKWEHLQLPEAHTFKNFNGRIIVLWQDRTKVIDSGLQFNILGIPAVLKPPKYESLQVGWIDTDINRYVTDVANLSTHIGKIL